MRALWKLEMMGYKYKIKPTRCLDMGDVENKKEKGTKDDTKMFVLEHYMHRFVIN